MADVYMYMCVCVLVEHKLQAKPIESLREETRIYINEDEKREQQMEQSRE